MNKRPLTTIVTPLLRGAFPVALLFIGISMIRFAQAQPQSNKRPQPNAGTSHNDLRSANGTKTLVRVHDNAERTQIAVPQQNYSVTGPGAPSGTVCGVESRAAHGQVAPNTNGGTLNPLAFANPATGQCIRARRV